MEENFFEKKINPMGLTDLSAFIKNCFDSNFNYMIFKYELVNLLKDFRDSLEVIEKKDRPMSIYMVLN
jgi:hypothetical protein